jgi:hypothetical protein
VTATERNAPAADSIGVALWAGDRLVASSRWTGFSTLEQALNGGLVSVR